MDRKNRFCLQTEVEEPEQDFHLNKIELVPEELALAAH